MAVREGRREGLEGEVNGGHRKPLDHLTVVSEIVRISPHDHTLVPSHSEQSV